MLCILCNLCSVHPLFLSYTVSAGIREAAFNASVWSLAETDIEKGPSSKPGASLLSSIPSSLVSNKMGAHIIVNAIGGSCRKVEGFFIVLLPSIFTKFIGPLLSQRIDLLSDVWLESDLRCRSHQERCRTMHHVVIAVLCAKFSSAWLSLVVVSGFLLADGRGGW